ncbi:MAG: glycosyltransferase family 2 protein [Verrucomicrobia bacterium]|nr:glycosyltransferase family 2 protein [Verrucomicrobiota bacterium]MBT7066711.1 glycosyltransferase family 2 protein [Verrucomicrobiota bacterium]MBT7700798.1 glycosyltransferase family 2 protein [Verrucomicrobiota bacterium]
MNESVDISIVVPAFNEEGNIAELHRRLVSVLGGMDVAFDIIFVDDGSSDGTLLKVSELAEQDPRVKAISFSRNFGHMKALCAGLDYASGAAVITMDADLQHPPDLIPALIAKWREGFEIVGTIREEAEGTGGVKALTSRCFYSLMSRIAGTDLPRGAADYRLLDRSVVETLTGMHERSRFLRGLIGWVGYKKVFLPYRADERFSGTTKYSFSRMLGFAADGITSFSSVPLKLSAYVGAVVAMLAFVYAGYAVCIKLFTDRAIAGWASVLIAVLFVGGVQLIFLGVIGEYLSRVYEEAKQRPLYIVRKKIGL